MRVFLAMPDGGLPAAVEAALRETLAASPHSLLADAPPAVAGFTQSERNRFLTVVDRLMEAEMLVADVSAPDTGVGWCIAWMLARGRLVVLTVRQDARPGLAAMVSGNPSPWQRIVAYSDDSGLRAALAKTLAF